MLLGYFLNQIENDNVTPVNPETMKPGSVLVAVADMARLRETGLPCSMRFGIAVAPDKVICRCCETEDIEHPTFIVKELTVEEFTGGGLSLYQCSVTGKQSQKLVVLAARMHVGVVYYELCSYPGDDFVAECLSGQTALDLIEKAPKAGQHWWTPLKMTLRQGLRWLDVGVPYDKLPDAADIQVFDQTHHGIAIEAERVIHFSTRRVPDGRNLIKTDTLKEFRSIGDDENSGSAVKYDNEVPADRLKSRNRAVWVFCHADEWDEYSLWKNNCEHFSRYCRVGRRESRQVIFAVVEALGALRAMLPRTTPFRPLLLLLGGLIEYGAKVLGRPQSVKVNDDLADDQMFPLISKQ